ncbi:MAG: DUF5610 domain-containing protein [Verrucomicrobiales bacterium]
MVQNVQNASTGYPVEKLLQTSKSTYSASFSASVQVSRTDQVSFSKGDVSKGQAQGIDLDRAYEKLRAVVGDARTALGLAEGEEIDTSPNATADRIADFAINFFSKYAENNGLEDNEEGRKAFADFIGGAINQGIEEAKGILTALSAFDPEIQAGVEDTASYIQKRLDDFVKNGLSVQ